MTPPKTEAQTIFKTLDGFQNFAAKLGVSAPGQVPGSDNLLSLGHYQFNLVTRNRVQLEAAYRGSWIVGRVVDTKAKDMVRSGIDIVTNDGAEEVQEFKTLWSRLQISQSLCETLQWASLYGGAVAVLQLKGQELDTPLDLDTIGEGQFQGLAVYDRWQLNPTLTQIIDSGPEIGLPKFYDIALGSNQNDPGLAPGSQERNQNGNAGGLVRVHHSRCIRLIGLKLPYWQAITEMMWGESVLERMWDRLIAFDDATMSAGNLISRAQLRTVGVDGLRQLLAAGGAEQEALVAQFEYMRQFQNNEGITLIDKEDMFASTAYSFAGLSDMMIQFGQQVSGAAEIPLVALFGQSPAGLSATGESDLRLYYDSINADQEARLRNPVEMISKVLWRSMTGQPIPDDFSFTFAPLWQMTAVDKATIAKTNTDTIIEAFQAGAIDTSTMMKELKESSGKTGLFTHITDEAIEDAEGEEPPMPAVEAPAQPGEPGEGPATPKPSVGSKIKDWIARGKKAP